jgi:VIT1/CCC1 family predicted Fe2+/Mn2+ transporter
MNLMVSMPEERPASPPPVTWLAEPLKRFHDEAWHTPQGRLVREIIFGLNDGVISTIGFLAGVTATLGDVHTIALGGIAAAIAGAVAMGVGAFVSSKSQRAFFQAEIAREAWEIENMPEHERQEIREIYQRLGFTPDEVDIIVRRVTSSPELWLRVMSREELGLAEEVFDSPVRVGLVTSLAYQLGALLLLVPYALTRTPREAFEAAVAIAVVALLATGAGKTWVTKEPPVRAALELAGLGILACVIGLVLGWVVGVAV